MNTFLLIVMFVFFTITYFLITRILALVARERINVPRDYESKPMVTVMMSCFNEGKAVYDTIHSIRSSNYPADRLEIIVRDDCSKDDSYEWMMKAAQDFPGVNVSRNKTNQGKPYTMCDMAEAAKGEILISTDSDCVLDPEAIREMVSCFKDPKIGSIGGRIGIRNVNATLLTQAQTITYGCTFFLFKASENVFKRVQCLGGALVAFRRELFLDCIPHIRTRNFLGNPILTAMVLACWGVVSTFLITPWAIFTIDDGGWITRQITEETKS